MKKRLLISSFLAVITVQCISSSYAQEFYASASQHSSTSHFKPLKKVMHELHLRHGIYFMFNNKNIQQIEVDARTNGTASIEETLRNVLSPVGLTYKKVDKIYIILERDEPKITSRIKEKIIGEQPGTGKLAPYLSVSDSTREELLSEIAVFSVSGKVTTELGDAMPGVNVLLKGTNIGVVTDAEGQYKLEAPDGTGTLVFSFIGYLSQEVPLMNRQAIDVQMQPDIRTLNEVVVVGYGTQKRAEITAAVASVKAEEFRQSGARNALDLIQGKVAGLTITRTSGTNPNSGVSIQIRGITSLTGSTSPLVVIDGIPGGNLDLLQQEDIASIDVLKDGSAAAIYGTQANGGVILVTTKKGKPGPPKFDYSTYIRREYIQRRPKFLTADEYRAKIADGSLPDGTDYGSSIDAFDKLVNHSNLSQYHTMALSGGADNTSYRASLYYQDLQGIALENRREQYGLRLNLQQRGLNNKLSTQINLATNFNNANLLGGGGWEDQLIRNPTLPITNPDGTYYFEGTSTNQVARLYQETSRRQQQTSSVDAKVSLELIPGLKGSFFGALQRNQYHDSQYRLRDSESSVESTTPEGRNGGYAYRGTTLEQRYAIEPTLEYTRSFASKQTIGAIAGYSWRYELNEGFDASNTGFINDVFEDNNIGTGSALAAGRAGMSSFKNDNTIIAFFGRINYAFDEKYFVQAVLRREGSSRFGSNNKWGNFPAVSAGWNISRESFMQGITFLDDLKIRGGYGVTGNSGISNYSSLVTLGTGGNYINPDGIWRQTYGPNRNPNPDLRWEKKKELNIGLDFSLFNNRLSGAFELYSRKTEDLLETYTSQLPPFVRESIYTNVGTIATKGLEITLNGLVMAKGDFTWRMDVAASTAKNTMESFSNDVYKLDYKTYGGIGGFGALGDAIRTFEGGDLGTFYGKRFAGFDENGKWLFYKRDGSKVPFDQINNSINPEESDLAVIGNAIPKYYLSWTNSFAYKNFDLRIYMRGKFGYDILNTMQISYGNQVSKTNLLRSAFTDHAALKDTYQYSDYYLEPGDYLKLDEVSLGYNFRLPTSYIRNLRVYVNGSNLAIFTKYSGNDPDFVNDTGLGPGIDSRGPYPSTRSFLIGLNVGF
ncbi:SusC/RagA family TonB-linked outer membrane protein [Fulvivirgaceae bacterium PWU4]|uniref:SusC/RagA family TonB-linked outer membrane protein n=1 Tax=Chryseosolibacter histidini TaxID=2782349 RepID=A0AAP2GSS1_9BACT|nr:SusC/RagA family TonB-linked outer membrane protein [Chryseosolibacter histidini]MBT1700882.1 SusC/RagA family TonB-linked outer membrane protein [Chryseosolibacter histidini]